MRKEWLQRLNGAAGCILADGGGASCVLLQENFCRHTFAAYASQRIFKFFPQYICSQFKPRFLIASVITVPACKHFLCYLQRVEAEAELAGLVGNKTHTILYLCT